MEERHMESTATKAFVKAVVNRRVRRKLRQKYPWTINDVVKHIWIVELGQLRKISGRNLTKKTWRRPKGRSLTRVQ